MNKAISKLGKQIISALTAGLYNPKVIREITIANRYANQFRAVCPDKLLADRVIAHCFRLPDGWRALPALSQICQRGETSWEDVLQIMYACPSLLRDPSFASVRFRYNRCGWDYFKFSLVDHGPSSTRACLARQFSDQMCCDRCNLLWDVNDLSPPRCEPWGLMCSDEIQPAVDSGAGQQ